MIVSIHIPRAAGVMLGTLFDFASGRRVFFDYGNDYRTAKEIDPEFYANLDFIANRFRFIHGHFFYSKYESIFEKAQFICCVRHPVDRLVSQFRFEVKNALLGVGGWQAKMVLEGKMDLVEFVESDDNIRRTMSLHLEGRRLSDYDFVFVYERLSQDIERFFKLNGLQRQDPWSNVGLPPMSGDISRALNSANLIERFERVTKTNQVQLERVYSLIGEDVDLYKAAL